MNKQTKTLSTEKKHIHTPVKIKINGMQFIFTKSGLAKYVRTMHSFSYKERKLDNERYSYHYSIHEAFVFNECLLEVNARNYSHYCPLGISSKFDVWYDGKQVANFRSFRGYAGAGSNGNYPFITDGDWHIVFWYDIFAVDMGTCSIEIYKTLLDEPDLTDTKPHEIKKMLPSDLDLDCEGPYWGKLAQVRELIWSHAILDEQTGKYHGRLSLYEYPGYAYYDYRLYGKFESLEEMFIHLKMIGRASRSEFLQILAFDSGSFTEYEIVSNVQISGIDREELHKWRSSI